MNLPCNPGIKPIMITEEITGLLIYVPGRCKCLLKMPTNNDD